MKLNFPFSIQFAVLDILYDLNLIPNEKISGINNYRDNFYRNFIEFLIYIKVPFNDFINFTVLFDIEKENRKFYYILLERYSINYVIAEIDKYRK